MLTIDSNEEMINDFHKYMKYNMVLISSLRVNLHILITHLRKDLMKLK